jgi:hypothetical protein
LLFSQLKKENSLLVFQLDTENNKDYNGFFFNLDTVNLIFGIYYDFDFKDIISRESISCGRIIKSKNGFIMKDKQSSFVMLFEINDNKLIIASGYLYFRNKTYKRTAYYHAKNDKHDVEQSEKGICNDRNINFKILKSDISYFLRMVYIMIVIIIF